MLRNQLIVFLNSHQEVVGFVNHWVSECFSNKIVVFLFSVVGGL